MATATRPTTAPARYMQGVAVPAEAVDPAAFFKGTRRKTQLEQQFSYTGQPQQTVELRKSDILSGILIRFSGSAVINIGTGTVTSTARWPYDFIKAAKFTANGAANLINVSGLKLKIRDMMKRTDLNDRGVSQTVAGTARTQGTLARASESWGVGSNSTLASGTYPVELEWFVPVAEDEVDLAGAVFLATSTSDLTLGLDLESLSNLFVLTGNGTAALTGNFQVISTKFSIPIDQGHIVVPDLSVFHSMIQSRSTAIQNGENEVRIIGQGAGKALLRAFYQVWNGAGAAAAPLAMTTTNFGLQAWRYGNNETPDAFIDGTHMRAAMERYYNDDLGAIWGVGVHEFASENSFRDVVDMGTTSDLRIVTNIQSGVALASPAIEYVTETVFNAGQAN
jgi:hypothetical protein